MLVLQLPLVAPAQVLGQELEQQQPPHQQQQQQVQQQVLQIPQSHPVTQTRLQPLPRPPRKQ